MCAYESIVLFWWIWVWWTSTQILFWFFQGHIVLVPSRTYYFSSFGNILIAVKEGSLFIYRGHFLGALEISIKQLTDKQHNFWVAQYAIHWSCQAIHYTWGSQLYHVCFLLHAFCICICYILDFILTFILTLQRIILILEHGRA